MRGYFGIGAEGISKPMNVGNLVRSAHAFGASFLFLVDAHHTIEDCAIALGQALRQALGDKAGIARFGFALPMDEAEAQVLVDLSGRPYAVFEGAFEQSHIGAYPTQMTEHVFKSLAEAIGAAIHVKVAGENDHHKTEAAFKAFGRTLRQAFALEGGAGAAAPSTKGMLA